MTLPSKAALAVADYMGTPAVRIEDRLYRWSILLNPGQDRSSWAAGDTLSSYFEMKWRGEVGIPMKGTPADVRPEKWERVRE